MTIQEPHAPAVASFAPVAADALARPAAASDQQLGLAWLLRLRWGAVVGQLLMLAIAHFVLAMELPYGVLSGLVAVAAATNLALSVASRLLAAWQVPVVLVLDVLLLTALLACSGGATNPCSVFFLVHVALAALLVRPLLAWTIVTLTVACFAALFFVPGGAALRHDHGPWSLHLLGMWGAYVVAAGFVTYFVGRVSLAIRDRDQRLAQLAELRAQNERLATLSSFSANAAHELGTPLATIGIAAQELALGLCNGAPAAELAADAELVGREIVRCRDILAGLSARAGECVGEMPVPVTAGEIVELVRGMTASGPGSLGVEYVGGGCEGAWLVAPRRALAQMLHNLVRNAVDAQEEGGVHQPVVLRVAANESVCFHVLDRGPGVAIAIRARLGEPFVTTKSARGGLGLGVYLARSFAERMGGHLRFHARADGGSEVELCLPRDCREQSG
jgi:two-component system, sensor histidine kinase RegB